MQMAVNKVNDITTHIAQEDYIKAKGAPSASLEADFSGQLYIDSLNKNVYIAIGEGKNTKWDIAAGPDAIIIESVADVEIKNMIDNIFNETPKS